MVIGLLVVTIMPAVAMLSSGHCAVSLFVCMCVYVCLDFAKRAKIIPPISRSVTTEVTEVVTYLIIQFFVYISHKLELGQ